MAPDDAPLFPDAVPPLSPAERQMADELRARAAVPPVQARPPVPLRPMTEEELVTAIRECMSRPRLGGLEPGERR